MSCCRRILSTLTLTMILVCSWAVHAPASAQGLAANEDPAEQDEPGLSLQTQPRLTITPDARPRSLASPAPSRWRPDRSVSAAYWLSIGGTLGGAAMGIAVMALSGYSGGAAGGLILFGLALGIGPSLGHFYAGEWGHGTLMSLGRLASSTLGFVSFFISILGESDGGSGNSGGYLAAAIGFGALTSILVIYDMVDSGAAVKRRFVEQRRRLGLASLRIAPMVSRSAAGNHLYGLAGSFRF